MCYTPLTWGHQLGHDAVAVGDQHRLTPRHQADVFAELVLEDL